MGSDAQTQPSAATHRRLIPDSGCAEEREGALSSGEGDGLGVTASFSVSSLQTQTVRSVKPQNHREITPQIAKHTHTHTRVHLL